MHTMEEIIKLRHEIDDVCMACSGNDDDCKTCMVRRLFDELYKEERLLRPITADDVKRGFLCGLIRLENGPDTACKETVCRIGGAAGYYFYFGGVEAEEEGPWEYASHMDFDEIISDIVGTLAGFRETDPDEWFYYRSVLNND